MNLLELLRKLGILRFGATAATYKSGTERPAELMMDDVYDAKKDLVGGDRKPGEDPPSKD